MGRTNVSKTVIPMEKLEEMYRSRLGPGGRYHPPDCQAHYKVAIVIPYRNRKEHLQLFIQHMHPFLQRQQIDYGIFVIEQSGSVHISISSSFIHDVTMKTAILEVWLIKITATLCVIPSRIQVIRHSIERCWWILEQQKPCAKTPFSVSCSTMSICCQKMTVIYILARNSRATCQLQSTSSNTGTHSKFLLI